IMPDGRKYAAHVVAYSSHDGTYAVTIKDASNVIECANMLRAEDSRSDGRIFRVKHTANLQRERQNAANIMVFAQERADYHPTLCEELLKKKLSAKQLDTVFDKLIPIPADKGRGQTIAINKRDQIRAIYAGNAAGSQDQV